MAKKLQPLHWFPFDTDRWLGEIAGGLTAEQKGALSDLLAVSWTQVPPCTLPDDNTYLASRSGLGSRWKRHRDAVLRTFAPADGGRLVCAWLLEIYNEQFTKYTNRSTANRTNRRGSKESTNEDTKDTTNPSTNGVTNRGTNRGQEQEKEGVVPPATYVAGVEHPPAAAPSLAPVGAAPLAATNGNGKRPPPTEAELFAEDQARLRAEQSRADEAAALARSTETRARRSEIEKHYWAQLDQRYVTWANANERHATRHEDAVRVTLTIKVGEVMHPQQAKTYRRVVLTEWRDGPSSPSMPDLDTYIAEQEAKLVAPDARRDAPAMATR